MDCINLFETFGDKYRITWDSAYDPNHVPVGKRDPWMMQIPCAGRGVVIFPHGRTVLAIEVDRHPGIAAQLSAITGVRLHQCGDAERTFVFDVSLFDQVARIVRPRKRRTLTELQLQVLAKHAFQSRDGAQKPNLERAPTLQADMFITQGRFVSA